MKPEYETVIDRAERLAEVKICSICKQVLDHPELRGKMFRHKAGKYVTMSFSQTLVEIAGGIDKLLSEWEEDA